MALTCLDERPLANLAPSPRIQPDTSRCSAPETRMGESFCSEYRHNLYSLILMLRSYYHDEDESSFNLVNSGKTAVGPGMFKKRKWQVGLTNCAHRCVRVCIHLGSSKANYIGAKSIAPMSRHPAISLFPCLRVVCAVSF